MSSRVILAAAAVAASLLLPSAASASDFPLEGWWPLNEGKGQTVRDWSGNGNHGFLGSTPATDANDPAWVKGIFFGSALNFGGDDYVTIPDGASLEQQRLTVSLWFRASGSPGTFKYLIAKGAQNCTAASYSLQTLWHGGLQFVLWNGSQQFFSGAAGTEVWDGKWHHAAGTFDGTTPKLFIDGKLVPGGSVGSDQIDYAGPGGGATIGGYHGTCDLLFAGDIDEVHVWSKPLPVDTIWARLKWLLGIPGRM
jgi:Concanavalin A-like lectin/glucanases superfamily